MKYNTYKDSVRKSHKNAARLHLDRAIPECCTAAFLKLFSSGDHFH